VEVRWRKSSHSGNPNGDCVEVAFGAAAVGVRDSKNVAGPRLAFSAGSWRKFVVHMA
jgi:hypothetical protein